MEIKVNQIYKSDCIEFRILAIHSVVKDFRKLVIGFEKGGIFANWTMDLDSTELEKGIKSGKVKLIKDVE